MESLLSRKKIHTAFVATSGRYVVGWSVVALDSKLPSVFVLPQYRHKGVGLKLFRKVAVITTKLLSL